MLLYTIALCLDIGQSIMPQIRFRSIKLKEKVRTILSGGRNGRHDTYHNDIQHNGTQHERRVDDTQHK